MPPGAARAARSLLAGGRGRRADGAATRGARMCTDDSFACDALPPSAALPALVVFDLDHTLWTPELYQLRQLAGYQDASGPGPVADVDVRLFDDARRVLVELAHADRWQHAQIAIASRTNKGRWARSLLQQFKIGRVTLHELIPYKEIYSSSKTKHFAALHAQTGVAYEDMLFFDDAKACVYI